MNWIVSMSSSRIFYEKKKDATLTLKSEAGRVFLTLSMDHGSVQDLSPRGESRKGPELNKATRKACICT